MTSPFFSFIDPNQTDAVDPMAGYAPPAPPMTALPQITSMGQGQAPSPGWAARLFGGQDPLAGGVVNTPEASGIGRQALRQFGISLLQNSGPAPYKRGLGELLGTALQSGQQAYQQGVGQAVQQQQTVAERLAASRLQAIRARYAGRTDPASLTAYMSSLIGEGSPEAVRGASAISEYLKSQGSGVDAPQVIHGISGRDPRIAALGLPPGESFTAQVGRDGNIVGRPMLETPPASLSHFGEMTPAAQQDVVDSISNAFDRRTKAYTTAHDAWSQVNNVLQRANSDTHSPDDIVQLIDGISRLNNPGIGVRVGTVQVQLQKIGSLAEKLRIWSRTNSSGAWPKDIVDGIARAARSIAEEHRKQYNDIRRRAIAQANHTYPGLGVTLDIGLPDTWGDPAGDGLDAPAPTGYVPPPAPRGH